MKRSTPSPTHRPPPRPAPPEAPRVLVIVGPTASGKTRLGIELARRLGGEVLSADSQQLYRALDIGTAKPTAEERREVPHHLVDVAEPTETLSAGEYARRADEAVAEVRRRGRLPVVVGGTGLYVRALLYGIVEVPPADPAFRAEMEALAAREGRPAVHARLQALDPETAATMPAENLVRVVRALELHHLTGEKPSVLRARHGFGQLRYRAKVLGLAPPRAELYARIDARARQMFESGLLEEVRGLLGRGLREAAAMRALGYSQAMAVLDGVMSPQEAVYQTALQTRHYAKRQLTWFRADPLVEWLAWPPDADSLAEGLRGEGFCGTTS